MEARLEPHLADKRRRLADVLQRCGSVLVACSRGVASVFPAHGAVPAPRPGTAGAEA